MNHNGIELTPATKQDARSYNYTWDNGKGEYPHSAGYVFETKEAISEQIYSDYPSGRLFRLEGYPVKVGRNSVIGGDGFGWYGNPPKRFPHIGHVRIGQYVEIGSLVTIDRGAIGDTIIGDHVKIDNGCHIGHNATIGQRSILTAHCVIGGSAVIGDDCWVGLGAQIKNQIRIGTGVTIGMGAIVITNVPDNVTMVGNPARILE